VILLDSSFLFTSHKSSSFLSIFSFFPVHLIITMPGHTNDEKSSSSSTSSSNQTQSLTMDEYDQLVRRINNINSALASPGLRVQLANWTVQQDFLRSNLQEFWNQKGINLLFPFLSSTSTLSSSSILFSLFLFASFHMCLPDVPPLLLQEIVFESFGVLQEKNGTRFEWQ
jgi:hypothetical protein